MFESLDDPDGTPIDEGTRARVAAVVRRRAVRRRVGVAVLVVAALAVPTGVVLASGGGGEARTVSATDGELVPTTTTTTDELDLEVVVPRLPTTSTTTTTARPTTTTSASPPTTSGPAGGPTLDGEWMYRGTLEPEPNYGPHVRGEAGARRVPGTTDRWTASFVATGLEPNSQGHFLISHESTRDSGSGPFASTACRYQADANGRGTCTGEFDSYEYTNDPGRTPRVASVMGPTGNAVAYAPLD